MTSFIDFILGADSDSGLRLNIEKCPACGAGHQFALTRLDGRFVGECQGQKLAGQVQEWVKYKDLAKPKEDGK